MQREHAAAARARAAGRRTTAAASARHTQTRTGTGAPTAEQVLMATRRGRKVRVAPAGRKWIRINPDQERVRRAFRVGDRVIAMPPRIQRLVRGFSYRS